MKTVLFASLFVLAIGVSACATPEEIEGRRLDYESRKAADEWRTAECINKGGVVDFDGRLKQCVSPQEAQRRNAARDAERAARTAEEEREKDREAALTQACISSGGSHYSKYTGCMSGAFVHTPPPPVSSGGGAQGGIAFFKGEHISGMNKICYYDRLGSAVAITIRATELCPLSLP